MAKPKVRKMPKTADDSFGEALKMLAIKGKVGDKPSIQDLVAEDNKARAKFREMDNPHLKPISKYPISCKEYKPSTGESSWQRLIGVEIQRIGNGLPFAVPIYQPCMGVEEKLGWDGIDEQAKAKANEMFPGREPTKEEILMCKDSLISQYEYEEAKKIEEPKVEKKVEPKEVNKGAKK